MASCKASADLRSRLRDWFEQPLGQSVQAIESHRLREVWPHLHGTVVLQLGCIGSLDLLDGCGAPTRIVLDLPVHGRTAKPPAALVLGVPEALPFDTRSVDLVLLPHTLEFCADPHQVLREVQRVLTPEGCAVVLGFNPFSLWGFWRLLVRRSGRAPWCGHFIQLPRIKDWIKLLDFELTRGSMLYYRPPLQNQALMDRLHLLDKIGDRWWPMAAAVYLLVARKRVAGMIPMRPAWRTRRILGDAVTQPLAKDARHAPAARLAGRSAEGGRGQG
ncbi:MAG: class I SAM-dependent methyltransferase [Acidiferrobacterales bacterium]